MKDYRFLQNGSDVRGTALTCLGKAVDFTGEAAGDIAAAFARRLYRVFGRKEGEITVAVGRDSRLSGPALEHAVCEALRLAGVKVLRAGLASTPAMFMSCIFPESDCDGAIIISASHLPADRNGMKFFERGKGGLDKGDIKSLLETASAEPPFRAAEPGSCRDFGLMERYAAHLRGVICEGLGCREGEKPLKDLKVAVDAGNGAGGFYATDVLAPLGADVSASQYLEPDGNFPNHAPNPEDAEAAGSLSRRVLECGADLGIIFDTDVDRVGAAGSDGKSIARNRMIALGAFISGKGGAIVTDSVTSTQLAHFLKSKGYEHLRYKRGYKNVINKGLELNGEGVYCPLAAETSGHAALRENYFLDDGAYLAAKIVIRAAMLKAAGGHIEDLISDLKEPLEAAEYRLAVTDGDFAACSAAAIEELRSWVGQGECGADNPCGGRCRCGMSLDEPNYEWVRVNCDRDNGDGWFLLRQSLHEPVMPLNIESNSPGGVALIASKVAKLLEKHKGIDISSIKF